jgi:hypothetical protein
MSLPTRMQPTSEIQSCSQGPSTASNDPADEIAKLKRFITINASGNTVDCAIAQVNRADAPLVVDQMKNNLMPTPNPNHQAVGLLFAGGCNRTLMNPIGNALSALNIQFTAGAGSNTAGDIGMNVEKVGRTSEYTTSTITEIDVSVTIQYNFGPASFDHQIATSWLSDAGDSGSIRRFRLNHMCRGSRRLRRPLWMRYHFSG